MARTTAQAPPSPSRIGSIDVARGVVMVLMAIDHVRVYSGLPAGGPSPALFFTRWVTNFVAPAFVFLAGTSASLREARAGGKRALAIFLVTRGLWLVLLELTVVRVLWTFNFDFAHYLFAGVLWMLGWSMVLLAGIVFLPRAAIVVGGVVVIIGHNVIDFFPGTLAALRNSSWIWKILYTGGGFRLAGNGPPLYVLYVLVPWVAVMAVGYAFGSVMMTAPQRRRAACLWLGGGMIAAFIVFRALDLYGDPHPWSAPAPGMPTWLALLNTTKYPPSLLFLLMTLGPLLVLLGLVSELHGRAARVLATFGRVPFFYYVLHIPTIHLAAVIVSYADHGFVSGWLFENHPMGNGPPPVGYPWSLATVYVVWVLSVMALYVPCRWFARVRAQRRSSWLSYL